MNNQPNIFLIGPMGAGKTSVGRALAQELGADYFDSDQMVQERTGADIPWIFDIEGEEGFRIREAKIIEELTNMQGVIISTGGGAILRPENRQLLAKRGTVIYLHVSVELQVERTKRADHRPLLQNQSDPLTILKKLYQEREPLYEEIADYTYYTDGKTVREIVKMILHDLPGLRIAG